MLKQKRTGLYEGMYILSATLSEDARKKAFEKITDGIIPKYDFLELGQLTQLAQEIPHFSVREGSQEISNTMWSAHYEQINLHLLEMHHPLNYFKRGKIYGFNDDVPRFLYFSKAVTEYLKIKNRPIDIIHIHDWHTAAISSLIRDYPKAPKIVLSLHNLEYQGKCGARDLEAIGITNETLEKYDGKDPIYRDSYNALKGGIEEADAIVPVSLTYAKEILTPQYGCGLDSVLLKQKAKIVGILNGIDETLWDPSTDPHLKAHFKPTDSLEKIKFAKKENQTFLEKHFALKAPKGAPWVGAITRIVAQKGPEFLEAAIEPTLKNGGVFALLGSSPIPEMQQHFEKLKKHYKNNRQVLLHFDFDETLAHQLYAAFDFILLPSHFEPCGLAQLIGMHYGATPIVRSTGGLKDTVFDAQNGYTFEEPTIQAFIQTLNRAMELKKKDPSKHDLIMSNGLKSDFGWQKPTQHYLTLYQNLLR